MIQLSLEQECKLRAIARSLHRAPSSISRELRHNGWRAPEPTAKKGPCGGSGFSFFQTQIWGKTCHPNWSLRC
ncbi:MAG: helix-turn-helix domain-containing protein [Burkholderia sp.]